MTASVNKKLRQELEDLSVDYASLSADCADKDAEIAQLKADYGTCDAERDTLKAENERLQILIKIADELITNENAKEDWESAKKTRHQ